MGCGCSRGAVCVCVCVCSTWHSSIKNSQETTRVQYSSGVLQDLETVTEASMGREPTKMPCVWLVISSIAWCLLELYSELYNLLCNRSFLTHLFLFSSGFSFFFFSHPLTHRFGTIKLL
ncbi:unnamed protein product [Discosporangium mesarthrocarpum]